MIVAFLGPTLPVKPRGIRVLPPAQRGDVWRALKLKPRAIALIDGYFDARPSVWHHEILDALDAGVQVFGGASMGALRAAELHSRGMIGVGRIFRWYRDEKVIDDSEVALLHADAEHSWMPLTVPLVNIRWAAQRLGLRGVVEKCARIFYQDRTWPRVLEHVPPRLHDRFRSFDLKADDAREVLRAAAAATPRPRSLRQPPPHFGERALLAGWARDWGLRASATTRREENEKLESLVLDHAERMVNDGPRLRRR